MHSGRHGNQTFLWQPIVHSRYPESPGASRNTRREPADAHKPSEPLLTHLQASTHRTPPAQSGPGVRAEAGSTRSALVGVRVNRNARVASRESSVALILQPPSARQSSRSDTPRDVRVLLFNEDKDRSPPEAGKTHPRGRTGCK